MFVLIIPILIAVVVIVSVRRRADAGAHAPSPAVTAELVERWRAAALISPDQAAAITEYERAHAPVPPTPVSHGPVVAEILGYVGAVLAARSLLVKGRFGLGYGITWQFFQALVGASSVDARQGGQQPEGVGVSGVGVQVLLLAGCVRGRHQLYDLRSSGGAMVPPLYSTGMPPSG